jgi:hypothetical protein
MTSRTLRRRQACLDFTVICLRAVLLRARVLQTLKWPNRPVQRAQDAKTHCQVLPRKTSRRMRHSRPLQRCQWCTQEARVTLQLSQSLQHPQLGQHRMHSPTGMTAVLCCLRGSDILPVSGSAMRTLRECKACIVGLRFTPPLFPTWQARDSIHGNTAQQKNALGDSKRMQHGSSVTCGPVISERQEQ